LRLREDYECIGILRDCLLRAEYGKGENMQNIKEEEEKTKEEPKLDTSKTTRNGGYTIPVQMY